MKQQAVFICRDLVDSDFSDVIQRCSESDGTGDVRSAGFELEGWIEICGLFTSDAADHAAAALVRRHGFQKVAFAVQDSNTCGSEHLMSGERIKIGIQRPNVDSQVRRRLGAIDQRNRANLVCQFDNSANRGDRPQRV